MAMELNQEQFQAEVLSAKETVLADFWAPWCGPCRMQAPVLEAFSADNPSVKVVKINVDDNQDLAERYGIMSIPSLLVFKNGTVVKQAVGLQSKANLEEMVR